MKLTVKEAAAIFDSTPEFIYKQAREGKLKNTRTKWGIQVSVKNMVDYVKDLPVSYKTRENLIKYLKEIDSPYLREFDA